MIRSAWNFRERTGTRTSGNKGARHRSGSEAVLFVKLTLTLDHRHDPARPRLNDDYLISYDDVFALR